MSFPINNLFMDLLKDVLSEKELTNDPDFTGQWLAKCLDEKDPIRDIREQFHIPKMSKLPCVDRELVSNLEEDGIYLCGNSLGLLPKCTEHLMAEQFAKWADIGVFGHFTGPLPWAHCDEYLLDGICELVGAKNRLQVAMMNSLTMNIHLLFTAFFTPTQGRFKILLEAGAFPSDHYAIESQLKLHGLNPKDAMICLEPRKGEEILRTQDILKCLDEEGPSIAIVFFSGIQYYSGQFFEIEKITKYAQEKGCLVGWDMAHAFANVPLKLHDWNVDFACWCSYKYGCSGAGGIGGVFIHERYAEDFARDRRLVGWWSHRMETRFQMNNELELASGAAGFRVSNPPFMLSVGVLGFLKVIEKTSMDELHKKSVLLTGYLEFLIQRNLIDGKEGINNLVKIITPADPAQRGCQLSLKFNCNIKRIYEELVKRGVCVDKRYPHVIRVAPIHLYNSFNDVWRFIDRLLEVIRTVQIEGNDENS